MSAVGLTAPKQQTEDSQPAAIRQTQPVASDGGLANASRASELLTELALKSDREWAIG